MMSAAAFAQQPRIDSVSPAQGPIAGGTVVTLTGANFSGAAITLDRVPITPISQSDSEVRLRMPKRDNGYAVIAVTSPAGAAYGEFLYLPPALEELPPGYITTVAGVGHFFGDYRPATRAIVRPWGLAFDRAGNTYIAEAQNDRVVRVRADGILEPFAGNGRIDGPRPTGPAPALEVPISFPRSVAVDAAGNVYIPDSNYYLWRVTPDGVAQIIAGTGRDSFSGDGGPAVMADIGFPNYVAVDTTGNVYFISYDAARIRKIDRSGIISTIAGTGTPGFSGDGGPATQAQFKIPGPDQGGLAIDEAGNLFLLDYSNARIRRIDATTGWITTVVDPALARTALNDMKAVAIDGAGGNLYFSQAGALIFRRSPDGTITQLSSGRGGFSPDGTLFRDAPIGGVASLAIDGSGELVFSETARVRKVDASGRLQTLAGVGPQRADEGTPAVGAALVSQNFDVDFLPSGELVFDDVDRIRKIDRAGIVTTVAGSGTAGPGDGVPALEATIAAFSVAAAADGSIDFASGIVGAFTIGRDGIVRRVGQFSSCDFTGDGGSALEAKFCQAWDAIRDRNGNLLIADTNNNRIRRVDRTTGIVTTIAGSGPSNGWEGYARGTTCGDGGPATAACINTPYGIAVDDRGNLYVSQIDVNGRIRKIDSAGMIMTFAEIATTKLITFRDHLYAVSGDRVLRFSPDGAARVIAGTPGRTGFSGDGGPATEATIRARGASHGIAVDAEGNLFFSDGDNRRIRAVRYGAVLAPPNATIQTSVQGSTIRAVVFDATGGPAPGVRVDFTAPASGASCTLSSTFAITDASGVANVNCTSNCVAGSYTVTARPLTASATASVSFTNVGGPCRRGVRSVPYRPTSTSSGSAAPWRPAFPDCFSTTSGGV